jgi:hypothetical protein
MQMGKTQISELIEQAKKRIDEFPTQNLVAKGTGKGDTGKEKGKGEGR